MISLIVCVCLCLHLSVPNAYVCVCECQMNCGGGGGGPFLAVHIPVQRLIDECYFYKKQKMKKVWIDIDCRQQQQQFLLLG